MSKNNIRQNYFNKIRKVTEDVEKAGEQGKHFRCILLMGDEDTKQGFSFIHASDADLQQLLLHAMRHSNAFTYAAACAFEAYDMELRGKGKQEQNNDNDNEADSVQEA